MRALSNLPPGITINDIDPPEPTKVLCIYHADCTDGWTAAWVVNNAHINFTEVTLFPAAYGDRPPYAEARDKHVFIVDFSYPLAEIQELGQIAKSVTILDHHKTAKESLDTLPLANPLDWNEDGYQPEHRISAIFDMERSGAGLAWDFFHYNEIFRLALVNYIEDYDLWKFNLPNSREINAYIQTKPYSIPEYDKLQSNIEHEPYIAEAIGQVLLEDRARALQRTIEAGLRTMKIGGVTVPTLNAPGLMASGAGNILAMGAPFAAVYHDTATHRKFSLRSSPSGSDVAEVAALYGGGGHSHSAGFSIPLGSNQPHHRSLLDKES